MRVYFHYHKTIFIYLFIRSFVRSFIRSFARFPFPFCFTPVSYLKYILPFTLYLIFIFLTLSFFLFLLCLYLVFNIHFFNFIFFFISPLPLVSFFSFFFFSQTNFKRVNKPLNHLCVTIFLGIADRKIPSCLHITGRELKCRSEPLCQLQMAVLARCADGKVIVRASIACRDPVSLNQPLGQV